MDILNARLQTDQTNVFSAAGTNSDKSMVKKAVKSVLENIKTNKLKYDVFLPYFHWLIKEDDLESIKALFDYFKKDKHAVSKFVYSKLPNRMNVLAMCSSSSSSVSCPAKCGLKKFNTPHAGYGCDVCGATLDQGAVAYGCRRCNYDVCSNCFGGAGGDDNDLLSFFLKNIRDKDLRSILMHRDENDSTVMASPSQKAETTILKHVMIKDKSLLSDLLTDNEWNLLRRHVGDKEELTEIFKYCDGRVLNEEAINKLLTECGWSKDKDEIRTLIMEKGKAFGVTEESMYNYVNPDNGNIPLHECMISGNDKLFDTILESMDLDEKETINGLIEYKNYSDSTLLHAACSASEDTLKYCQTVLDLCQFQTEREGMLSSKDDQGNNPLQLFLARVQTYYYGAKGSKQKEDNRMFPCIIPIS